MDAERAARAKARSKIVVIRKTVLAHEDVDVSTQGPEALSLVTRLTAEGWSLAGLPLPSYSRDETPYKFVLASRSEP